MDKGEKLGSFVIEGTLGVGAMGVVYLAKHEKTGRAAAVKVVSKEIATKGNSYERFEREGEILQQFRHPNIVQFYARGRYKKTDYVAMEFIQGKTLEQVLADRPALPWTEVVDYAIQVCDALEYAHEHGVVHRDLKPSNMMINEKGVVKLTDFGIAKDLDATALTAEGRTLGTAAYMAPEQIRGDATISHKVDLYQLGCVLFQLLTGRVPYDGTSAVAMMHGHLRGERPVPSHHFKDIPLRLGSQLPEIPKSIDDLIVRLMAKEPQDRPAYASMVADRLKEIRDRISRREAVPKLWPHERLGVVAETLTATETKPTKKKPAVKRRAAPELGDSRYVGNTRRMIETAGLIALLLGIGGVIGYALWPPSPEYLYAQAERLMSSEDRHDWVQAKKEYLDKLDAKYPDNPYKEKTQAWRDKLSLTDSQSRARSLQSEANTGFNKPNGLQEEKFVQYYTRVAAAVKRGDERAAAAIYEEMAGNFRPKDNDDRPWYLLAKKRASDLNEQIASRGKQVMELLNLAQKAEQQGHLAEAASLKSEVRNRYGKYTDVAELLGDAPTPTPASPAPATTTPDQTPNEVRPPEAVPQVGEPR